MTVYTHDLVSAGLGYYVPSLLNPVPFHRITPGASTAAIGATITSIPPVPGPSRENATQVIGAPTKRGEGKGYTYANLDGIDDQLRLVSTPTINHASYTTMVVARLKEVTGFQSIFFMTPPGGNRLDLSVWSTGQLTFSGTPTADSRAVHPWTPDTDWHVFSVVQNPTSVIIGVDDTFAATTGIAPMPAIGLNIGQKRGGGFQAIDVADAIVFPSLIAEYRAAEARNLMSQYGIEWNRDIAP